MPFFKALFKDNLFLFLQMFFTSCIVCKNSIIEKRFESCCTIFSHHSFIGLWILGLGEKMSGFLEFSSFNSNTQSSIKYSKSWENFNPQQSWKIFFIVLWFLFYEILTIRVWFIDIYKIIKWTQMLLFDTINANTLRSGTFVIC